MQRLTKRANRRDEPARRLREVLRRLQELDMQAFDRVSSSHSPLLDATLPRLTRTADHSVLWASVAAALIASNNPRLTHAARRGLLSIAATSFTANFVAKQLLPRDRPDRSRVPLARLARRIPTSPSFPSGHSASAAAFAFSVGREVPELAVPIGLLAGAVAYSRIYTGVHYPGDVLAGIALGGAVAIGVNRIVRTPEPEPDGPVAEPAPQPPRPDGAGVVAVINPSSGVGAGPDPVELLRRELPAAEIIEVPPDGDLLELLVEAAQRAEVLGVSGGDGSVACAAGVAVDHDVPLLVLCGGTFNHFAADVGIEDPRTALAAVRAGHALRVDVTRVAGRVLVNTASVGAYPEFVTTREKYEKRLGKPVAAALALLKVARRTEPLDLLIDGRRHRTSLFFLGSGRYAPRGFAPNSRTRLDDGLLDVRVLDADGFFGGLRTVATAILGHLERDPRYREDTRATVVVQRSADGPFAYDGEVVDGPARLEFVKQPGALVVFAPTGS
ncbi:phosphatase PAP2 family protein [Aldersonia sp. NBC_00410]|uniref:bifunctional phosphatase PAP2/diacylglycerol kinase family protein n=1 Tax=Aldersonia sp. NBC_00410 TaxID=2975954 RepID=UPI00225A1B89|nr:phosphatase PAP2 family protein [Aldersonia sp. NBC_00410]MCX5044787.1 phosphatase PAP2 family protein [Aldersonia sp. NBC_00410]